MANIYLQMAEDLRTEGLTNEEAERIVDRIYGMGYRAGVKDQKRMADRAKYKYSVLMDWLELQLSKFQGYTRKPSYKEIINRLFEIVEQYKFENGLNRKYIPKINVVKIESNDMILDMKKEMSYLLFDVVQDFIDEEERKEKELSLVKPADSDNWSLINNKENE